METGSKFIVPKETDWPDILPSLWEAGKDKNIWLLTGDLGSGKTTMVKHLIRYLGGREQVTSPTYSIVNEYNWTDHTRDWQVFHLDLYRLESVEEVINIGFEELLYEGQLLLIEWPEVAMDLLPDNCFNLELSVVDNQRIVLVL